MIVEGLDFKYEYLDKDPEFMYIRILTGLYENTLYKYGKVKVEEKNADELYFNFEYEVIESTIKRPKKLTNDQNFKGFIADILLQIMSRAIESKLIEEQDILDEIGTNDSQEFSL